MNKGEIARERRTDDSEKMKKNMSDGFRQCDTNCFPYFILSLVTTEDMFV